MSKVTIYKPKSSKAEQPFYESKVPAGFPSPATEYLGDTLDLNDYLIKNKTATFFATVEGDSMIGAGIYEGDLLVIDRSKTPLQNSIVIAVVDNEFTVKRLCLKQGIRLLPANDNYQPIILTGTLELQIWGVVTSIVRKL
ncbi:MAG: translesion error-prone DNA polymerase V autoproteolytic subunit [Marinicella sp.]